MTSRRTSPPARFSRASLRAAVAHLPFGERVVYLLVAAWTVSMITVPIQRWVIGDAALPYGLSISVAIQVAACFAMLTFAWGIGRALAVAALVIAAGWAVEYVGHTTGFPFGGYAYTERLQPQLGGVPILIPLAWMMMMPPSWALAALLTGGIRARAVRAVAFVLASAVAFTAWDLFLDPQMTNWGIWQFDNTDGFTYFGIPWSNYGGWLLASGGITLLCLPLLRLHTLPLRPAVVIYAVTWALQACGLIVFWGLVGPGIVGTLGMGAVLAAALWRWHMLSWRMNRLPEHKAT